MANKLTINKDINNRLNFQSNNGRYRVYQLLLNDLYLPIENRQVIAYSYIYSRYKLMLKSSLRNRCVVSGRTRSVYSFFKLTRMIFKNIAVRGDIVGVTKNSW